jgi:hypothetical protein
MKKLIFLFSLLSSFSSFGQCVNLYIKEHLDGDPICRLKGNKLEMCFDNRQTISGGDCTFYIQSTRMNGDVQIYEFGLDKTTPYFYAPKYGELMINTATKKLGIQIDDNWGSYSYYNEAEMQKIREFEKIENEKRILEQKKNEEKERKIAIKNKEDRENLENQNLIKLQSQLNLLINKFDYLAASEIYINNNGVYNLISYFDTINKGLVSLYNSDTVLLKDELINEFIKNNKEKFIQLTPNKYEFRFNHIGQEINSRISDLDRKNIPVKILGPQIQSLKLGDRYLGGIVISISKNEIIISSTLSIGSGSYSQAQIECNKYLLNSLPCRLPSTKELESIFVLKKHLDNYENNWYWTNNERGEYAEHIGISAGDRTFVPKTHGKYFFAVRTIAVNNFNIPLNSKIIISVAEQKDILVNTDFMSSSKKSIFVVDEGQYCLKSKNNLNNVPFKYDQKVAKNIILVEKTFETLKTVNNLTIQKEIKKIQKEFTILKKC